MTKIIKSFRKLALPLKGIKEKTPGEKGIPFKQFKSSLSDVEFSKQLLIRQTIKFRFAPNMTNKQFQRIVNDSKSYTQFKNLLSMKLDYVILSLRIVPTYAAARQYISHGNVFVNGKQVRNAHFSLKIGDLIHMPKFNPLSLMDKTGRVLPLYIFQDVQWSPILRSFTILRPPNIQITQREYQIVKEFRKTI